MDSKKIRYMWDERAWNNQNKATKIVNFDKIS